MSGPDVEGVLGRHRLAGLNGYCGCGWASVPDGDRLAQHRAHVAAALRAEVRAWLESKGAVSLIAGRMLKVESPDGLWAHLTPLERERFSNHATCALAALAEQVGQVASVGEGEG